MFAIDNAGTGLGYKDTTSILLIRRAARHADLGRGRIGRTFTGVPRDVGLLGMQREKERKGHGIVSLGMRRKGQLYKTVAVYWRNLPYSYRNHYGVLGLRF
jgi:hypothetical protein